MFTQRNIFFSNMLTVVTETATLLKDATLFLIWFYFYFIHEYDWSIPSLFDYSPPSRDPRNDVKIWKITWNRNEWPVRGKVFRIDAEQQKKKLSGYLHKSHNFKMQNFGATIMFYFWMSNRECIIVAFEFRLSTSLTRDLGSQRLREDVKKNAFLLGKKRVWVQLY